MRAFHFDPVEHVYTLDGKVIPGCTSILKRLGILDPRYYTIEASQRGTRVHLLTERYDNGVALGAEFTEDVAGYLEAWIAFRGEKGFVPMLRERPLYSNLKYGVTEDAIGVFKNIPRLGGRPALVEIKSGEIPDWIGLQTAAQRVAARERAIDGFIPKECSPVSRWAIQLRKNGTYKLEECEDFQDETNWMACLRVYGLQKVQAPMHEVFTMPKETK